VADFVVDYAMLEQIEKTLTRLKSEFEQIDSVEDSANWGDAGIAAAMGSFASNWKDHREKLLGSIEAMGKSAYECRTQTIHFDTDMQRQVTKH
jgi:hypothetical protein